MEKLLLGKVAIVTGGTRGIGFAIVKKFLLEGATVVICGSRQESAEKAKRAILDETHDARVEAISPILTDINAVQEVFGRIYAKYGKIDILVNNAGISQSLLLKDYTDKNFTDIMDLNVKSIFVCSQVVLKYMKLNGGGVILNTSSVVSLYGQPSGFAYPASKFAVNGITKSLARELGKDHIRVNAVAPGVVETDMVRALPAQVIQPIVEKIPLGRMAQADDIANAFLYLASDMAAYVSGTILSVDGAVVI